MPTPSGRRVSHPLASNIHCPDDQQIPQSQPSWARPLPATYPPLTVTDSTQASPSLPSEDDTISRSDVTSPASISTLTDSIVLDEQSKEPETAQELIQQALQRQRASRPSGQPRVQRRFTLGSVGTNGFDRLLRTDAPAPDNRRREAWTSSAASISASSIKVLDTDTMPLADGDVRNDVEEEMAMLDYGTMRNRHITYSPSSLLRSGSRYRGTQQSERQQYKVDVEIKQVDIEASFLCGYLRIQGLTEEHDTLTTYFEGEIIGPRYSFMTKHDSWGATDKVDRAHWSKFAAFHAAAKQWRKNPSHEYSQREHIFMRWKERFLVPDHRVTTINGASFEGFYYICFNQIRGEISGIYFHAKSESRFQQLELKHVEDRGVQASVELR